MSNPEDNADYEEFYFNVGDEIKAEDDPRNPRGDYNMDALGGGHTAAAMNYQDRRFEDQNTAFDMLYGDPDAMDIDQQRAYPLTLLYGGWPDDIYQKGRRRFNDMGDEKILGIFDTATMSSDQLDSLPAILQTDFLSQEVVDKIMHRLENLAFEVSFNDCDVRKLTESILLAIPLLSIMGYLTRDEQEKLLVNLEKAEFENMMANSDINDGPQESQSQQQQAKVWGRKESHESYSDSHLLKYLEKHKDSLPFFANMHRQVVEGGIRLNQNQRDAIARIIEARGLTLEDE